MPRPVWFSLPAPPPHDWQDCMPGVMCRLKNDPDPARTRRVNDAAELVFFGLPQEDRMLFHQATCLGRRDKAAEELMERFGALVIREVDGEDSTSSK